jgi:hypothetical protein
MSERPSSDPMRRGGAALRVLAALVILVLLAANALAIRERRAYAAETARLRSAMTGVERERADATVASERHTLRLAVELLRRQARLDAELHLSVSVDSSRMYLERDGALLRDMPVLVGAERQVGLAPDTVRLATPRGVRTIVRVLSETDSWPIPAWVRADRGLPPDANPVLQGALGPAALLLEGGAIIYTLPNAGPLNDSTYVLPGAIRARAEDLRAILPNVTPGMRVFFY